MSDKEPQAPVVTRFAPSPTGLLHAGNYRTAIFSYLYAKKNGGKFILRIEDTDKARSKKEYEDNILDSLKWLGLRHDEIYRQSDRTEIYKEYLQKLIDGGNAYLSKEEVTEEGGRAEVVRFKNPNKAVKFNDLIRGEIEFHTAELGDFVIAKSLTEPIFHFVVVLDDYLMGVTHIVRGEDHISNTPRHILLQEALGAPTPIYAHLPLVLAPDRSKLSKRKGALAITEYRDRGYLSAAIINFLSLLGWNPGTEQEIFDMPELIRTFDLAKVQKGGAIFNEEKLKWFNKEYIKLMTDDEYVAAATTFIPEKFRTNADVARKIAEVLRDRISVFGEIRTMCEAGDFDYLIERPTYLKEKLLWKDEKDASVTKKHIETILSIIGEIAPQQFFADKIKELVWPIAEKNGKGNVLWPMRFALSGKDKSPDPFTLASMLGKDETIKRLSSARDAL